MHNDGRALSLAAVFAIACVCCGTLSAVALAGSCPNERIRTQEGKLEQYAQQLPDCRAYEQVSPVDKNYTDALGRPTNVQSSPTGGAVTYYSIAPFPGTQNPGEFPTYRSSRKSGEWLTEGLLPALEPGFHVSDVLALTEDLSETVLTAYPSELAPLPKGVTPTESFDYYVRDNETGQYDLLDAAPGFGETWFADATLDGSHIIFESNEHLLPEAAPPGDVTLYEWNGGQLSVAGLLPGETQAPEKGAIAGPGGPDIEAEPGFGGESGGARYGFYTQNTISTDGSRIFFTDVETGDIYMRQSGVKETVPVSAGTAYWRAATPSGSFVLYSEGDELYRFNVADDSTLSQAREKIAGAGAGVVGTLGMSNDASDVYFVAEGVLADNENSNNESPKMGKDNLYVWHETPSGPETTFIADLNSTYDKTDWHNYYNASAGGDAQGAKGSRVIPDGQTALFSSTEQLTSYDNAKYQELYLYDASSGTTGELTCVSCNPDGAPATAEAYLMELKLGAAAPVGRAPFLTRNLSDDGTRVFFQTTEALVPGDTNGQTDVYEWEKQGTHSCPESDGNCVFLISTGTSGSESAFGEASESGGDVFFFTSQPLVSQDTDSNIDVYDAREDGGISAQNAETSTEVLCESEACRGLSGSGLAFGVPASATLSGAGNPVSSVESKTAVEPKAVPLTRGQKLAVALNACKKEPKKRRGRCRTRAQRKYGTKVKKSNKGRK